MREVSSIDEMDEAIRSYNQELAQWIFARLGGLHPRTIVEFGSGAGNFTMGLLETLDGDFDRLTCMDPYPGPYREGGKALRARIDEMGLLHKVEILEIDALEMERVVSDVDLVIGREIFCDLEPEHVEGILSAGFNCLSPTGILAHSEFAPFASTRAEGLLFIVDEHAKEPISETTWFSPNADWLAGTASEVGFGTISVDYLKLPLKFVGEAASEMARKCLVKEEFWTVYKGELETFGIEYPMEQVLICKRGQYSV